MSTGDSKKYFTPEDKDYSVVSADKSHLHKEAVLETFETSINETVIRQNTYVTNQTGYIPTEQPKGTPSERHSQRRYNDSERFSHINDAEQQKGDTGVLYGTVEQRATDTTTIGGRAGDAIYSGSDGVFKVENRRLDSTALSKSVAESIKSDSIIKPISEAAIFADKTWNGTSTSNEKKGLFGTVIKYVGREIEAAAEQGSFSEDMSDRVKQQATKYGLKGSKFIVVDAAKTIRGSLRIVKYGAKLNKDVKTGVITTSEARKAILSQSKNNIFGASKVNATILKDGMEKVVEDFKGSDDLGMQTIAKPKEIYVKTKHTFQTIKFTGRALSKGVKTSQKIATKVSQGIKAAAAATKKIFSNPVVIKGLAIGALVVFIAVAIISIVSAIVGAISSLTLKSEDFELSQTYLYVTELDARLEEDIVKEETRLHFPTIDEYEYFINGYLTTKENMIVYTDADLMLAFLDSKYDDYSFDGIIAGLFGTTVKDEVKIIHQELHQLEKIRRTERVGKTTIHILEIRLTTKTLDTYIEENKDTLLTKDQQERLKNILNIGVYSMRKSLKNPFVGHDWISSVTSRWGWRIDPITGNLSKHTGLDIAMPGGTPINATMGGIASTGYDASYGNYVKIENSSGDYTLYAHMDSSAVLNGAQIKSGDVIGYVGTTGASTGNHLHLEYYKKGKALNPLIFTEN